MNTEELRLIGKEDKQCSVTNYLMPSLALPSGISSNRNMLAGPIRIQPNNSLLGTYILTHDSDTPKIKKQGMGALTSTQKICRSERWPVSMGVLRPKPVL
jgi:hypothetical protein